MSLHGSLLSASPAYGHPIARTNGRAGSENVALMDDIDFTWSDDTLDDAWPGGLALAGGPAPGISDVSGWHPRIADY